MRFIFLAQIGTVIGHRPIPDGNQDVLAKQVHRLPEPPATGRTLWLLQPVLRDPSELRPGII